jgi:hypothetical protein
MLTFVHDDGGGGVACHDGSVVVVPQSYPLFCPFFLYVWVMLVLLCCIAVTGMESVFH